MPRQKLLTALFAGLLLATSATLLLDNPSARASEHEEHEEHERRGDGDVRLAAPRNLSPEMASAAALWKEECGSCHMAFPPSLLPPEAWRQHMADLSHHYGSDASLPAEQAQQIQAYLEQASARSRIKAPDSKPGEPPRITDSRWFQHEHDEISASTLARPSIGSISNCTACHSGAEQGDFERVKIPKQ